MKVKTKDSGKLRIGDNWNAIRIIALSQSNPLKAIAEFVENSIDAHAKTITITRGKEHGAHYLAIRDDGDAVPRDYNGLPDFKYVATHICDSIKRRLKADGNGSGLQGEFGIGLLSAVRLGRGTPLSPSARSHHRSGLDLSSPHAGPTARPSNIARKYCAPVGSIVPATPKTWFSPRNCYISSICRGEATQLAKQPHAT